MSLQWRACNAEHGKGEGVPSSKRSGERSRSYNHGTVGPTKTLQALCHCCIALPAERKCYAQTKHIAHVSVFGNTLRQASAGDGVEGAGGMDHVTENHDPTRERVSAPFRTL